MGGPACRGEVHVLGGLEQSDRLEIVEGGCCTMPVTMVLACPEDLEDAILAQLLWCSSNSGIPNRCCSKRHQMQNGDKAKGRRRAQREPPRKTCKPPGLKHPSLGTPNELSPVDSSIHHPLPTPGNSAINFPQSSIEELTLTSLSWKGFGH